MKKIPIFLSILTASLGNIAFLAPNSFALYQEGDTTWWTVEEMLEFSHQVDDEKEKLCHGDQDCEMEYNFTMYEKGDKYRALENFLQMQFWITSVNPGTETVKVLFFDEDMMLKRMGVRESLEIEHLYLGWFSDWKGQIYNYNHDSFTDGSTPGSHPLYDSTIRDLSTIVPWEEIELSVSGGDLVDNLSGKIDYAIFAKHNMFNAQGYFDYSSCLRADDYTIGAECQLMVSADQWVTYLPPRETIIDTDTNTSASLVDTDTNTDSELAPVSTDTDTNTDSEFAPASTDTFESPVESTDGISDTDITAPDPESELEINSLETAIISRSESEPTSELKSELTSQPEVELSSNDIIKQLDSNPQSSLKSPETGKNTTLEDEHSVELPWWFQLIIILNGVVLLWLFWPDPEISHKTSKNRKKSLDKNHNLR